MSSKVVGCWLLGCAGMVYGAVSIGGVTRLTESGLSMVKWDLFKTMKPPLNQREWEQEFNRYKTFPEYKFKASSGDQMSLTQFKFIWTMEYMHRMWGRSIGIAFFAPCAYFWNRGRFSRPMKIRMLVAGSLILSQGLLGWWMVKSGLDPRKNSSTDIPRVSQYRLAAHLSMAFALYTLFLSNGLSNLLKPYDNSGVKGVGRLRGMSHANKLLIFSTVVVGAFVAGLDAGLVYNSWPKYANSWMPDTLLTKNPRWKNFFENEVMVQFMHRNLIHFVPTGLAALHQSGSLLLMSFAISLSNELKRVPK